ncbi:MAG: imidazole glycerol phosphate synthase subunit HisF [Bradymonadaceae bacterium]
MLTARIIPCLDVADGRVVKGVQFQELRDEGDPAELSFAYQDQGADEIVMLDVSATPEGRATRTETVERVREDIAIPLTVGGGVRSVEDAAALLSAGADKVAVNTAAVRNPEIIDELAEQFGSQCTVISVDARRRDPDDTHDGWEVVVHSGQRKTSRDAIDWVREIADRGAGEILLTSWDRDGTRSGYDLALLREAAEAVDVPIIASGGANGPDHFIEAFDAGADAVLAASIFHEGDWTVEAVKERLAEAGLEVRR